MLNREIYERDPKTHELANDGVVHIAYEEGASKAALDKYDRVLRFELSTFVCSGQYQAGLEALLQNYLDRLRSNAQPAPLWISGFYGAGKSHLAKMMGALWCNHTFADGASAESLVSNLPASIRDLLKELRIEAKKHGGTHLVAGMLGRDTKAEVLPTVLGLVFKSVGLPGNIIPGRFALWLKEAGYYDAVAAHCAKNGRGLAVEAENLIVSKAVAEGLLQCDPSLGPAPALRENLRAQFKNNDQVDGESFLMDAGRALRLSGKIPLTLAVLDEVQQFIGSDGGRTLAIQQVAELCQNNFDGKVQLVATGQAAMGSTEQLEKLKGRFPVTVHLTDQDQEDVIRQTVLQKALSKTGELKATIDATSGEINRHLIGTKIAASTADEATLIPDYPILPTRRRFFEAVLRAVDESGVISQLRNQLRIAYQAALETGPLAVGNVIGGDFIFNELQSSSSFPNLISNELFSKIRRLDGSKDPLDQLKARALKLIFLINKLPRDAAVDLGVRATVDTLADLLVTDLIAGSSALRADLPGVIDELESKDRVIMGYEENGRKVYREQTAESAAWYADFTTRQHTLRSEPHVVESKRSELLQEQIRKVLAKVKATQGALNTARKVETTYEQSLPAGADKQLTVWVQDGWQTTEAAALAAAKSAGLDNPTVFVYIPDRDKSDLHDAIVEAKAAEQTLHAKGEAATSAGKDARKMMEGHLKAGNDRIDRIILAALTDAKVYAGGGSELDEESLGAKVQAAIDQSLPRLYPTFSKADHKDWPKVLDKSAEGVADAIKLVGHAGDVEQHPVCADLLAYIGTAGKKGVEVQERFENPPFGWPRDAVQGALMALLANGVLVAKDPSGAALNVRNLDRKHITRTFFRAETDKITAQNKIDVRTVLKKAGITCASGEEPLKAGLLGKALSDLRLLAGGPPPAPDQPKPDLIAQIEACSGNAQVLEICRRKPELEKAIDAWTALKATIAARTPAWVQLETLIAHADGVAEAAVFRAERQAIVDQRALLHDPDPVTPLLHKLTDALRAALNSAVDSYASEYGQLLATLQTDDAWTKLAAEQQPQLLRDEGLSNDVVLDTSSVESIVAELAKSDLNRWRDRTAALSGRFETVRRAAAKLLEPKSVRLVLPGGLFHNEAEVRAWLTNVEAQLLAAIKKNPVQL